MKKILFVFYLCSLGSTLLPFILPQRCIQPLFRQCLATNQGAQAVKGLWLGDKFYSYNREHAIQLSIKEVHGNIPIFAIIYNISRQFKVVQEIINKSDQELDVIYLKEIDQRPVLDNEALEEIKHKDGKNE